MHNFEIRLQVYNFTPPQFRLNRRTAACRHSCFPVSTCTFFQGRKCYFWLTRIFLVGAFVEKLQPNKSGKLQKGSFDGAAEKKSPVAETSVPRFNAAMAAAGQGCQMVYFQTKTYSFGIFCKALEWRIFDIFIPIWYTLW
jgi:hypothetical protein